MAHRAPVYAIEAPAVSGGAVFFQFSAKEAGMPYASTEGRAHLRSASVELFDADGNLIDPATVPEFRAAVSCTSGQPLGNTALVLPLTKSAQGKYFLDNHYLPVKHETNTGLTNVWLYIQTAGPAASCRSLLVFED